MKNIFIDKLVSEWAWRVNDGMPDPKKRSHVRVLEAVLRQYKYSEQFIYEYINQLTEDKEFKARSKESGRTVVYKSKEALEKAMKDGRAEPLDAKKAEPGEKEKVKGADLFKSKDTPEKEEPTKETDKKNIEKNIKKYTEQSPKTPEEQEAVDNKLSPRVTDDLDLITNDVDKYMENSNKEGGGTRTPTIEQVKNLKEFTAIRVQQNNDRIAFIEQKPKPSEEEINLYDETNPIHTHPDAKAAQREISDEQLDKSKQYLKDKLGEKKYKALIKKIADSGAWRGSGFTYTPEELEERASEILRLYLKNGGRCAVTGKRMKLSEMEPDHRVPISSGKGGDRKKELDSPRNNMDLMFGNVNQFKGSIEGNDLIHKARKELYREEGGIRQRKQREAQFKNARRAALEQKYTDDFNNDNLNITKDDILNMDKDEIKYLVEAHNNSKGMVAGADNYGDRIKLNVKQRKGRSGSNRLSIELEREHLFKELNKKGFNILSGEEVNEQQEAVDEARQNIRVQTIKDEIKILKYRIENEKYSDSAISKIKVGDTDPEKTTLTTSERTKDSWKKKVEKLEAELEEGGQT